MSTRAANRARPGPDPSPFIKAWQDRARENWKSRVLSHVFIVALVTVSGLMVIASLVPDAFIRFMLATLVVLVVLGGVHVMRGRGGGNASIAFVVGFPVLVASILLTIPSPDVMSRFINEQLHVNVDAVAGCVVVFFVLLVGLFITLAALLVTKQDIARERLVHKRELNNFIGNGGTEMSRKKYYFFRLLVLVLCNVVVLTLIVYLVEDPVTRYFAAVANAAVLVGITMYLKKRRGQSLGGKKEAGKTIIMILLKGGMPFVMATLALLVLDGRQLVVIVDGMHYMNMNVLAIQVMLWAFIYIAMFAFTFIMTTD